MFAIIHEYTVDGGYGDDICTRDIVGLVKTEKEAKEYCERYSNEHVYDVPYAELVYGDLNYIEVDFLNMGRAPYKNWYDAKYPWNLDEWEKQAANNMEENDMIDIEKHRIESNKEMKLVIYGSYGGFGIPEELKDHFKKLLGNEFWQYESSMEKSMKRSGKEVVRTDEKFIEYVRKNGLPFAIVNIPANATDYMINEYDGFETVYYVLE